MNQIVGDIDSFVWGPVMLCLLVGTGIYLTAYLNFRTWRNLPYAMKSVFSREARKTNRGSGDVSPFSALMTALAATIGTGNIVGVATAMFAGGPGALVWMWVSACFGLTTKFSECMLGFKFREVNAKGEMKGGPMFTMKNGFKNKRAGLFMGFLFAMFTVIASFGIGNMTQANSITTAVSATFGFSNEIIGAALTVLTLAVIVGGITSISRVSSLIVPGMAVFYIAAGLLCIALNFENIPHGLYLIFMMAFDPAAVEGGVVGTITVSVMNSVRFGVARGCFSNEAGLGSAAISAAAPWGCGRRTTPVPSPPVMWSSTTLSIPTAPPPPPPEGRRRCSSPGKRPPAAAEQRLRPPPSPERKNPAPRRYTEGNPPFPRW